MPQSGMVQGPHPVFAFASQRGIVLEPQRRVSPHSLGRAEDRADRAGCRLYDHERYPSGRPSAEQAVDASKRVAVVCRVPAGRRGAGVRRVGGVRKEGAVAGHAQDVGLSVPWTRDRDRTQGGGASPATQ